MNTKPTIIIAEDNDIFLDAYCDFLKKKCGFTVLAAVTNGLDLVAKARELQPDIIFTDYKMPGIDGIEACRRLEASHPHIRKICITMYDESWIASEMLKAGVRGFLLKNAGREEILQCIQAVHRGDVYISGGAGHLVQNKMMNKAEPTPYQLEVLRRLFKEQLTEQIAAGTSNSKSNVSLARSDLKRMAEAKTDFGLAVWAINSGHINIKEL